VRLEAILWTAVSVYFLSIGAIYFAVGGDTAGVVLLFAAMGLGGLIAGWTWEWTRRHAPRIVDRADTDASDELGIVGVYPIASLRPLALAMGTSAMVLGIAIGSWLSMIGIAAVASQVLLLVRDTDT
jgi:hypothetical protein